MRFVEIISGWINRYFSNEEAIFLVVFLTAALLILIFFGGVLAPVLTGLGFAFLLRGVGSRLVAWRVPRLVAVGVVEVLFLGVLTALVIVILPLVWQQLRDLVNALPGFLDGLRELAAALPQRYPEFFSETTVSNWIGTLNQQVVDFGANLVQDVVAQLSNVVGLMIFLILA
ncbi:MAG: AI-2E family transporter, partial [Gammaproteobacteria bacterium]|nr:AI-2E family transporter [Gammaproteobacteria bacterium]